jgi:hypothetical protein
MASHQTEGKDTPESVNVENSDMRPEYDFTGGVRGKHHGALSQGYTVKVHQPDGTTLVQHFELQEGTVVLEPDVRKYFPDSEAVNTALRCLIPLVANERAAKVKS